MEISHSKIKENNRKKIIKLLLEKNEITKLDISRSLDISITTVSTNISELKEIGIVEEVRSLESTGGRKAISLKIDENCRFSLGIALTPRHVKLSLINIKKEVIESIRIKHNNNEIKNILNIVKDNISGILDKANITNEKLLGICISIPGTVDTKSGVIKYCYLLGIKNYNIKKEFEYLNVPIYVDNEANLSAYYEFLNRKDMLENLLYISITDGLGLGIIINGKIHRGSNNVAGELGHIKIVVDGEQCECGSKGCLEAYTSKKILLKGYNESSVYKIREIEDFQKVYDMGDKKAEDILERYLKYLSVGISNLSMILDPSSIVIGGDINGLLEDNLDKISEHVYNDNSFINKEKCKIEITNFRESYLLGAAMVPIEKFLNF